MWRLVVKTLIFVLVVPGTFLIYIPNRIVAATAGLSMDLGRVRLAGWVPIALGVLLLMWCWLRFLIDGRGTPAPYDPPTRLVTGRVYQWVRNPMYIGVVAVLLGESVAFLSWALLAYAGGAWLTCHLFVVLYEEPGLRRRFGQAYEDYLGRVPRWLPWVR